MLGVTRALPSAVATGSGEAHGRPEKLSPHSLAWCSTLPGGVVREGRADGVPGRLLGPPWMPCPRRTLDPRPWILSAPSPPAPVLAVLEPNDKCSSPDGLWGGGVSVLQGLLPEPATAPRCSEVLGGAGQAGLWQASFPGLQTEVHGHVQGLAQASTPTCPPRALPAACSPLLAQLQARWSERFSFFPNVAGWNPMRLDGKLERGRTSPPFLPPQVAAEAGSLGSPSPASPGPEPWPSSPAGPACTSSA